MQLLAVNIKYVQALHHGCHSVNFLTQLSVGLALVAELVALLHPTTTLSRCHVTVPIIACCRLVCCCQTRPQALLKLLLSTALHHGCNGVKLAAQLLIGLALAAEVVALLHPQASGGLQIKDVSELSLVLLVGLDQILAQ